MNSIGPAKIGGEKEAEAVNHQKRKQRRKAKTDRL